MAHPGCDKGKLNQPGPVHGTRAVQMPSEVNAEGHVPELIYTPAGILLFVIWVHATPGSDNHPSHYTEFDLVILALHKCEKSMFNPGSCPHSINAIHSTGKPVSFQGRTWDWVKIGNKSGHGLKSSATMVTFIYKLLSSP